MYANLNQLAWFPKLSRKERTRPYMSHLIYENSYFAWINYLFPLSCIKPILFDFSFFNILKGNHLYINLLYASLLNTFSLDTSTQQVNLNFREFGSRSFLIFDVLLMLKKGKKTHRYLLSLSAPPNWISSVYTPTVWRKQRATSTPRNLYLFVIVLFMILVS